MYISEVERLKAPSPDTMQAREQDDILCLGLFMKKACKEYFKGEEI